MATSLTNNTLIINDKQLLATDSWTQSGNILTHSSIATYRYRSTITVPTGTILTFLSVTDNWGVKANFTSGTWNCLGVCGGDQVHAVGANNVTAFSHDCYSLIAAVRVS